MSLVLYCYINQWSDHIWNTQISCGVHINKTMAKSLKKIEKKSSQTGNKLKKDSIQGQNNAFKVTNFEIQAIAWRHDRGI